MLKTKIRIFQNLDFWNEKIVLSKTHPTTKTWYWNNFDAYCIWIESNIHESYYIYVFDMKSKNRLNRKSKPINFKLVCVCELEHINTIYLCRRSKQSKLKTNRSLLVSKLTRSKTRSNEHDSNRVLGAILTHELLNQHKIAPKHLYWS